MFNVIDIDECLSDSTHDCDIHAICRNTEGNFTCACERGFTGDGNNCTGKLNSVLCNHICMIAWVENDNRQQIDNILTAQAVI